MKKIVSTLIIAASIAIGTLFVFGSHQLIGVDTEQYANDNVYMFSSFYEDFDTTYAMVYYLDYLANREIPGYKLSNLYTFSSTEYPGMENYVEESLNSYLMAWERNLNREIYAMIDYYYYDANTETKLTNTHLPINEMIDNKDYKESYYHYIKFEFDANGKLKAESSSVQRIGLNEHTSGRTKKQIEDYILQDAYALYSDALNYRTYTSNQGTTSSDGFIESTGTFEGSLSNQDVVDAEIKVNYSNSDKSIDTTFKLNDLKNKKIYFAYNKEKTKELIATGTYPFDFYDYAGRSTVLMYYLFTGFVLFLLGLILPVRVLKEMPIIKHIKRIKVEFMAIIGYIFCLLLMSGGDLAIAWSRSRIAYGLMELFKISDSAYFIQSILVMIYIAIVLSGGILLGFMIRYIFHCGLITYLRKNSLIVNAFASGFNFILKSYPDYVFNRSNILIFVLIVANFVVVYVMNLLSLSSYGGYILRMSLVYSVILFAIVIVVKKRADLNYEKLKEITSRLAQGDLNIKISSDLGIYNGIRDDLMNIKTSFSNAVFEEVKSQRMKTELISNVSHDLKTPLTNIINYVYLLRTEETDDAKRVEYIDTIDRNSKRLKNLIEDLFEVSKLNSGNIELDCQNIDVCSLIMQVNLDWEEKFKQRGLFVRFNMQPEKVLLYLDSYKSHRIFENLFNNIYKYALENTRVYVDVKVVDKKCCIEFKNISATEIDFESHEATDRFVRGDKSRTSEGSGLGLAIARSLTELHGGKIEIVVDGDLFKAILIFDLAE